MFPDLRTRSKLNTDTRRRGVRDLKDPRIEPNLFSQHGNEHQNKH